MTHRGLSNRTKIQRAAKTLFCTHTLSLSTDETHRYKYCALFFAIIIDHRFLLNARAKNVRVCDAAPPRVQTRTTQGTRCRVLSLSLSLIECVIFVSHVLFCDNQATIKSMLNVNVATDRRHERVQRAWLHHVCINQRYIQPFFVKSESNIADVMTKPLA